MPQNPAFIISYRCPLQQKCLFSSSNGLAAAQQIAVNRIYLGNGCGAVGRVVASDTRDPRFESSHWQYFLLSTALKSCIKKTKIKKKGAGNGPIKKQD